MDCVTREFGDDIDVVRETGGFQGTSDQLEMFARALLANTRSYDECQAELVSQSA
jgi:hypothetical protein